VDQLKPEQSEITDAPCLTPPRGLARCLTFIRGFYFIRVRNERDKKKQEFERSRRIFVVTKKTSTKTTACIRF
jgi:hypothetical protein